MDNGVDFSRNPNHSHNRPLELWVGTYCGQEENGIIKLAFDRDGRRLEQTAAVSGVESPSFLAVSRSGDTLYAVEERAGGDGSVVALTREPGTGAWTVRQRLGTLGGAPCHLALDDTERFLFVANYSGGSVLTFGLGEDGCLSEQLDKVQHVGQGTRPDRQEGPHPHSVNWNAEAGLLLVPDLGLDLIVAYQLDPANGKLIKQAAIPVSSESGPRHYTEHPSLPCAYVINELDSTVTVLRRTGTGEVYTAAESVSTLPTEGLQPDANYPADLHLSPDGAFLYGSNRGHDSIAVFSVDGQDGRLAPVQYISTGGRNPRNFCLSPDGDYLLAANQDSDNVVVFEVDRTSGKLTRTELEFAVKKPVCLVWAPSLR